MPRSDALLVGRAGGGAALRDDVRSGDGGDEGDGGKGGNAAHGRSPVGTAEAKRRQGTASTSGGETQRFGSGRAARLEPVAQRRGGAAGEAVAANGRAAVRSRSDERRVGTGCVSTWKGRGSPALSKK